MVMTETFLTDDIDFLLFWCHFVPKPIYTNLLKGSLTTDLGVD